MDYMKKLSLFFIGVLSFTACQKSIDDQAERDTREYTAKYCPLEDEYTILDSMSFDRSTRTIGYHYRIKDVGPINCESFRQGLLDELRNATKVRGYKDAGFSFRYQCLSVLDTDSVVLDVVFQPSDYNQPQ